MPDSFEFFWLFIHPWYGLWLRFKMLPQRHVLEVEPCIWRLISDKKRQHEVVWVQFCSRALPQTQSWVLVTLILPTMRLETNQFTSLHCLLINGSHYPAENISPLHFLKPACRPNGAQLAIFRKHRSALKLGNLGDLAIKLMRARQQRCKTTVWKVLHWFIWGER